MDIIDLIITVVVIVGSMILSVKKKQKSLSDAEPYDEREWEFEEEETKESHLEPIWQKTAKNDLKPEFQAEITKRAESFFENEVDVVQNVEIEKETDEMFLFSQEEMRKAVIYSEILKRPCFE